MTTELNPQGEGVETRDASDGRRFDWRRLQTIAAFGILISFLVPMVIERSLEPFLLSMAAPFAIGLLLAMKWPRLAAIWLGIVALAVLLFSLPFIGEALSHPESAVDFIPLAVFALGSVVAAAVAIPAFREVRAGSVQPTVPLRVAAVSAALLIVASAWSVVSSVRLESMEAQPGDLRMATEDFEFTPVDVTTDAGTISIAVTNLDNTRHTFTITELGVDLSLAPGTTQRVTFTAGSGSYTFFCRPHPNMEGRLVAG